MTLNGSIQNPYDSHTVVKKSGAYIVYIEQGRKKGSYTCKSRLKEGSQIFVCRGYQIYIVQVVYCMLNAFKFPMNYAAASVLCILHSCIGVCLIYTRRYLLLISLYLASSSSSSFQLCLSDRIEFCGQRERGREGTEKGPIFVRHRRSSFEQKKRKSGTALEIQIDCLHR